MATKNIQRPAVEESGPANKASLLDLPELVLEEIAKQLAPSDLASCMMSCTTLHALLCPRQSANVRAHSFGRRWALRACGRALFADIGRRVTTGIENFEASEGIPNWDAWTAAMHVMTADGPELFKLWPRVRPAFSASMDARTYSPVNLSIHVYLRRLAESRGFNLVVGVLERVSERALSGYPVYTEGKYYRDMFQKLRLYAEGSSLSFQPIKDFTDKNPMPYEVDFRKLKARFLHASIDLLTSEVMCALWLVFFVDFFNCVGFKTLFAEDLEELTEGLGKYLLKFFKV